MPKLAKSFSDHGGALDDEDLEVMALLTPANVFGARYLVTGAFTRATTEALARTANSLHATVRDRLRADGIRCSS
jgi:hypothetical protein